MSDAFDPYYKWLGIPPKDQPPHHYRLLGIERFESDPDVISSAADGRMAQIKSFQAGQYSKESQRLLNEIASANVCLLNPEKKAQYDQKLQDRIEEQEQAMAAEAAPAPQIDASSVMAYVASRQEKRPRWPIPAAIVAVAVLAVGLFVFLLDRGDDTPVAERPKPPKTGSSQKHLPENKVDPKRVDLETTQTDPETEGPVDSNPTLPEVTGPETPDPGSAEPSEQPAEPNDASPAADPGRQLSDLIDPINPGDGGVSDPTSELSQEVPSAEPAKLPLPDKEARQTTEKKVREIFGQEFSEAKTREEKLGLAKKLSAGAKEATDPTERFVLLYHASETAAEAGDLSMALRLVDELQRRYDFDALKLKAVLLDSVVKSGQTRRQASADVISTLNAALDLAEQAVAGDDFEMAGRFIKMATTAARKTKDNLIVRRVAARSAEISRLRSKFAAVKKALEVLAEDSADLQANLTVGRWYCFKTGNWKKGLPLLANGADPTLVKLAERDLADPQDVREQLALADRWWELSRKQPGSTKRSMQQRASYWYLQVLPKLSGLEKSRVMKQIKEIAEDAPVAGSKIRGVIQEGNVALAGNGTTAKGVTNRRECLFDGNVTRYSLEDGFAYTKWPCEWIITFDKVYRLTEIRILLYDKSQRFYHYSLATSADGKEFSPLVDRSKEQSTSWQRIPISPPRPVKAVKFNGLFNSGNRNFHVVEFEAYCLPPPLPKRSASTARPRG